MVTGAWFVVVAVACAGGPEVAPPPRAVLPVVWEWDAGHPTSRPVVTETGEKVQVLVASGRLTIDPRQAEINPDTLRFRVREASTVVAGAFSLDSTRWCPSELGKGEPVPHSAARVCYRVIVVATQSGKPGGKPLTFARGEMSVEMFVHARALSQPELQSLMFDPVGYVKP